MQDHYWYVYMRYEIPIKQFFIHIAAPLKLIAILSVILKNTKIFQIGLLQIKKFGYRNNDKLNYYK